MTPIIRVAVASLALSAAGIGGFAADEGYTAHAVIPVPGDRWTYGFGSTFKLDGSPVKQGDTITPVDAIRLKIKHIGVDEDVVRKCVTAPVSQGEYDLLIGHAYQYGTGATCSSTLVKRTNEGRYTEACHEYARWTKVAGKDCRAPDSTCRGVAIRADARVAQCLALQQPVDILAPEPVMPEPVVPEPVVPVVVEPVVVEPKPTRIWPWALLITLLIGAAGAYVWKKRK